MSKEEEIMLIVRIGCNHGHFFHEMFADEVYIWKMKG
jgi:hypothetical protein